MGDSRVVSSTTLFQPSNQAPHQAGLIGPIHHLLNVLLRKWGALALSLLFHGTLVWAGVVMGSHSSQFADQKPHGGPLSSKGESLQAMEWVDVATVTINPAQVPTGDIPIPQIKRDSDRTTSQVQNPSPQVASLEHESTQDLARVESSFSGANPGSSSPSRLGFESGSTQNALTYRDQLYLLFESRKTYPQAARRLGQQGQVLVSLRIWADGRVDDQKVVEPSPYNRLNRAALELVLQVEKFMPLPDESVPYAYFQLPIEYTIN